MNVHKNARLTPRGRVLMIERITGGLQRYDGQRPMPGYPNAQPIDGSAAGARASRNFMIAARHHGAARIGCGPNKWP